MNATLSIVIPVHHAPDSLPTLVQDSLRVAAPHFRDTELILTHTATYPATTRLVQELATRHDPVVAVQHPAAGSYGQALVYGMAHARGDYILAMAANTGVHPGELERLLPYIEHHALVAAYRLEHVHRPAAAQERILRGWINRLYRLELRDPTCLLTLLHADLLHDLPLTASSPLIHTELYARTHRHQPCIQVGVHASLPRTYDPYTSTNPASFAATVALWLELHGLTPRAIQGRIALVMGLVALVRVGQMVARRQRLLF